MNKMNGKHKVWTEMTFVSGYVRRAEVLIG